MAALVLIACLCSSMSAAVGGGVYVYQNRSIKGRFVRIASTDGKINVAELGVFDENGDLISKGAKVQAGFENLNNGVLADYAHTTGGGPGHIQLDLGAMKTISEIVLVNRKDCCQEEIVGKKLQIFTSEDDPDSLVGEIEITDVRMVYSWTPTKTMFNDQALPDGVSATNTWIAKGTRPEGPYSVNDLDLVVEEGDCYNATRAAGHLIYGYRNESHTNPNTCFYYKDDPGWTDLSTEERREDALHSIGCTDSSKDIETGCQ